MAQATVTLHHMVLIDEFRYAAYFDKISNFKYEDIT